MRVRTFLVAVVATTLFGVASVSAGAGAQTGQGLPGPTDETAAVAAGRDAGVAKAGPGGQPGEKAVGPRAGAATATTFAASAAAPSAGPQPFTSARVFATRYNPITPGSFEVALPDKCAKFAALGLTSTLQAAGCPPGYAVGLDYRVIVTRANGQSVVVPLKDAGPWNVDDNYWDYGPYTPRPRRFATGLAPGLPEAEAAFSNGYNVAPDCLDLNRQPTGHPGAADQFGRCVLNPAGIDLSMAVASQLGMPANEWVTVTFLWEPLRNNIVSVNSAKLVDVAGASLADGAGAVQWSANGGTNQQWRLLPLNADIVVIQSLKSGHVLDVAGASTADGAPVVQHPWTGAVSEWWWLIPTGAGGFWVVSMNSGKVLDVAGASPIDGAPLLQWSWYGGASQQWRMSPIGNG